MSLANFLRQSLSRVVAFAALCGTAFSDEVNGQVVAVPSYDWRLVTQSAFIVKGELTVPVKAIRRSIQSKNYEYANLHLRVHTAIKGKPNARELLVKFYTGPSDTNPSAQTLFSLKGKEVLAFLLQSDEFGPTLYFAGDTPSVLQAYNEAEATRVRKEVSNQNRIIANFAQSVAARPDQLHMKVKSLIGAMLDAKSEEKAFEQLIALGPKAIPSTIRWMDDRRSLPIQQIELRLTGPNRFEDIAHYGPRVVVDALSTIVGHVAGESLGQINNGGSERERRSVVNAWRVYLYYRLSKTPK